MAKITESSAAAQKRGKPEKETTAEEISSMDPPQPDDEPEPPPARPHDPIEPDPMNPESVPSRAATEPQAGELLKEEWLWAEHED
ncbi:MAG TPA: hypothetical protein VMZ30_09035 [Pyrinomonadaceae bacterium]|nr:hypothetical protein [Pyrinomonadaceae bacterium]